ncbi:hypothetical protein NDU88_007852 [Pleurodeles waltl]|uniref:Uncharacterized protein n=1 Tax=Pleurodeles waltl TaxID=8319 RepID=A0AAV7NUH4_PLEWA|nr:hypothetical protein NDU88_007852 [Pleurodeles waltl]
MTRPRAFAWTTPGGSGFPFCVGAAAHHVTGETPAWRIGALAKVLPGTLSGLLGDRAAARRDAQGAQTYKIWLEPA